MLVSMIVKLILGLVVLLLVARLVGKKALSKVTPFDLLYTLVLGSILGSAMYRDEANIGHIAIAAILWAAMIYLIERVVQKSRKASRWLKGTPSVLIKDGKLNIEEINENHIEMEQMRAMLREKSCFSLKNAQHLVLEANGNYSVAKQSDENMTITILLVEAGKIKKKTLQSNGLGEDWLRDRLKEEGFFSLESIVYAEWSQEEGFYIVSTTDETSDFVIEGKN